MESQRRHYNGGDCKRLEGHGLIINHNRLSAALSNPFYCSVISHSLLGGKVVEGKHEKLVKEIFLKANMEKGKIPHCYKANPLNDNLPLNFMRSVKVAEKTGVAILSRKRIFTTTNVMVQENALAM